MPTSKTPQPVRVTWVEGEVSGFDDMVEQHGRLKRRRFDFDRGWIESWVEFEYDASDHVRAFFCLDKDSPFMPGYAGSG